MCNIILTNFSLILTRTKDHRLPKAPDPFGVLSAVLLEDPYFSAARSVSWLTCSDSLGRSASLGLFTTLAKEITPSAHRYCQNVTKREESKKGCCDSALFVLSKGSDCAVSVRAGGTSVEVLPDTHSCAVVEHVQCRAAKVVKVEHLLQGQAEGVQPREEVTGRGHHQFIQISKGRVSRGQSQALLGAAKQ